MFSVRKSFSFKQNFNNLGQGLIEIIAAVGIATLLILALVSLSTRATRNSEISKAKDQASKLATEGMEVIRSIKENATSTLSYASSGICSGTGGAYATWPQLFTIDVPDENCSNAWGRRGYLSTSQGNPACSGLWCLSFDENQSAFSQVPVGNRTYTRIVYIADTPAPPPANNTGKSRCNLTAGDYSSIKQFSVVVTWTDVGGDHQIVNTNCMTL